MHAVIVVGVAVEPGFLGGEDEDRREPGGETIEYVVEHAARRPPTRGVEPIAIKRILADVEIEGREILGAEIMQADEHGGEVERFAGPAHLAVNLGEPVQHPAFEFGHVLDGQPLVLGEAGEIAEQKAQGVAQAAIGIRLVAHDLVGDADILGIIRGDHPDAQDIGAILVDDGLGIHRVAQGFGHLPALPVEHETVGQHRVIGCAAPGAAGFEQG